MVMAYAKGVITGVRGGTRDLTSLVNAVSKLVSNTNTLVNTVVDTVKRISEIYGFKEAWATPRMHICCEASFGGS